MKRFPTSAKSREIHTFSDILRYGFDLSGTTIQNVDFTKVNFEWKTADIKDTVFLGCKLSPTDQLEILSAGGVIFPTDDTLCYEPYRSHLYSWQELYKEKSEGVSVDLEIYRHFSDTKYNPTMVQSLYRAIHDHSIDDALRDYLAPDSEGNYPNKAIGIMGGHGTQRTDKYYYKVARTAQLLSAKDYLVMSGGGPGSMEAANLGAYMGSYGKAELKDAIEIMSVAPGYTSDDYHETAMTVLRKYPNGKESLAIPTWFYGHEPSNVFASHIAKYFSNSIREDTLLAVAIHGILFAPGSAGTTQEIFMDAAQNHYTTFDYVSPMIFMGKKRYSKDTHIFQTLSQLAEGKEYGKMLRLVDKPEEAVEAFLSLAPVRV